MPYLATHILIFKIPSIHIAYGRLIMRQVDENYSPVQLEKDVRTLWEKTRIYEKVKKAGESGKAYYFLDGPPYTTGSIHVGTAWNKILKDTVIRYRRMQGLHVRDQPGYDMHGLPIEVKVEQALGIKTKKEIEFNRGLFWIEVLPTGAKVDSSVSPRS